MRVNYDAGSHSKRRAQNHVGGFSGHSWQGKQIVHGRWNLAMKILDDSPASLLDVFGLIPKETSGMDGFLQRGLRRFGKICRSAVLLEKRRGNQVHLHISALRRKDGGNQQFQRTPMGQGALGLRVGAFQRLHYLLDSGFTGVHFSLRVHAH
jgi:hypothetical protein